MGGRTGYAWSHEIRREKLFPETGDILNKGIALRVFGANCPEMMERDAQDSILRDFGPGVRSS